MCVCVSKQSSGVGGRVAGEDCLLRSRFLKIPSRLPRATPKQFSQRNGPLLLTPHDTTHHTPRPACALDGLRREAEAGLLEPSEVLRTGAEEEGEEVAWGE